jgi:maltose alpha-D-glucosyltransferase/alpha-amylase
VLAVVDVLEDARKGRYVLPLRADGSELRQGFDGDGTWRALAIAIAEGRTIPSLPRAAASAPDAPAAVTAALVCRPTAALPTLGGSYPQEVALMRERPVGADQSNTSVVLGERLIVKVFRRVEPGLNPDLELNAWLSEEVRFEAVPRLAGFVELVSADGAATIALEQEFLAGAADAYESTAERLTAWILAPGEVTVEFATEDAAVLGDLTAYLHAALAAGKGQPDFEPRDAGRDDLRAWRRAATAQLQRAVDAVHGAEGEELRSMAPAIADELTVFEAIPGVPILTRVHGDYHLGQILETPDGYRIIDFEGQPTRPLEERRRRNSPLRDVASMLRAIDHVGRSARRRAEQRRGGVVESPGLDIEAWLARARERFLESYRRGVRERGAPIEVDVDLLRAFEFEKECYEFIYAATYLPEWLWAPLEGMRALVASSAGVR